MKWKALRIKTQSWASSKFTRSPCIKCVLDSAAEVFGGNRTVSELNVLVDLQGFEPWTSSMPFKKYQSLAGRNTRNTRLSYHAVDATGRLFGGLDSTRTPGLHTGDWHLRNNAKNNITAFAKFWPTANPAQSFTTEKQLNKLPLAASRLADTGSEDHRLEGGGFCNGL